MQPFDERKVDVLARLLAAAALGSEARREALRAEGLDDAIAAALNAEVVRRLRAEDAEPLRARFRLVYAGTLRGDSTNASSQPAAAPTATASTIATATAPSATATAVHVEDVQVGRVSNEPASAPLPPPPAFFAPPLELPARVVGSPDTTLPDDGSRPPALPFLPAGAPRLSLEQIATYHAEIAVWPGHQAVIAARYGLHTEAICNAVETHWAERLRDALLRARHDAIVASVVAAARAGSRSQSGA